MAARHRHRQSHRRVRERHRARHGCGGASWAAEAGRPRAGDAGVLAGDLYAAYRALWQLVVAPYYWERPSTRPPAWGAERADRRGDLAVSTEKPSIPRVKHFKEQHQNGRKSFVWVVAVVLLLCVIAVGISYLTTQRPFSFSLVDRECENAQQQYYDANNRLRSIPNQNPISQDDGGGNERNHADVCVQKRMADAAEAGFWLLLFSLLAASGAAIAGWVTVRVMRDTARHEMRAYVGIYSAGIGFVNLTGGGLGITISFDFKNEGQTPAYGFTTWLKVPVVAELDALPFGGATPIPDRSGASILSPHTMAHTQFTIAISAAELAELQSGSKRIFGGGEGWTTPTPLGTRDTTVLGAGITSRPA